MLVASWCIDCWRRGSCAVDVSRHCCCWTSDSTVCQTMNACAAITAHYGSVTDPALLRRVLADGVDVVFHLVSVPGGAAEAQYELGYQVNLQASLELLNQLRNPLCPPVLVYASSVAVYGGELPVRMDEDHPTSPQLSYAAHKRMVEIALQGPCVASARHRRPCA